MIKMLTFSTQIPPCGSTTRYNTEMGNKDNQMKERKTPKKTPKKTPEKTLQLLECGRTCLLPRLKIGKKVRLLSLIGDSKASLFSPSLLVITTVLPTLELPTQVNLRSYHAVQIQSVT
jgi:hypothetical protein